MDTSELLLPAALKIAGDIPTLEKWLDNMDRTWANADPAKLEFLSEGIKRKAQLREEIAEHKIGILTLGGDVYDLSKYNIS